MRRILVMSARRAHAREVMPAPPSWSRRGRAVHGSGGKRHGAAPSVRDPIGMFIPEAHMRATHVSFASFDRAIAAASQAIVGLHEPSETAQAEAGMEEAQRPGAPSSPPLPDTAAAGRHDGAADTSAFGARFDRRRIRFQGRSRDFGTFAELATRAAAEVEQRVHESATKDSSDEGSDGAGRGAMHSVTTAATPPWSARTGGYAFVRGNDKGERNSSTNNGSSSSGGHATMRRLLSPAAAPSRAKTPTDEASTSSSSSSSPPSASPLAQALLSGSRGAAAETHTTGGEAGDGIGVHALSSSVQSRARRRAARRERGAARQARQHGLELHPCRLQGGCAHDARRAPCAFLTHPAVCCVEQLRCGHCAAAQRGDCPWHHAALDERREGQLRAEFFFAAADAATMRRRVQTGATQVGHLVQLLVDLVTAQLECSATHRDAFLALYTTCERQEGHSVRQLCALLREAAMQAAAGAAEAEAMRLCLVALGEASAAGPEWLLAVRRDVAACALADGGGPESATRPAPCGTTPSVPEGVPQSAPPTTPQASFYAMWDAEAAESACHEDADRDDCPGRASRAVCEDVWYDLRHLFGSYLVFRDGSGAATRMTVAATGDDEASLVCLAPVLTRLVLQLAVAQLRGESIGDPHDVFVRCAEAVLRRRLRACTHYIRVAPLLQCTLCGEDGRLTRRPAPPGDRMCEDEEERGRADIAHDWSPLLLLRDCLSLTHLTSSAAAMTSSATLPSSLTAPATNMPGKDMLLFDLLLRVAETTGTTLRSAQSRGNGSPAVNEAAATRAAIERAWDELHALLLRLGAGLLVCGERDIGRRHTGRATGAHAGPGLVPHVPPPPTPWLLSFVQPSLVQLARDCGAALAARYEAPLRHAIGWQPWGAAQFRGAAATRARAGAAMGGAGVLYTAVGYARHHMPLLAPSLMNALLNALMLSTLLYTEHLFAPRLSLGSSLRRQQLMLDEESGGCGGAERRLMQAQPLLWLSLHGRMYNKNKHGSSTFTAQLRPFIGLSLGFMNELESLGKEQQAQHALLLQQYEQRCDEANAEAEVTLRTSSSGSSLYTREAQYKAKAQGRRRRGRHGAYDGGGGGGEDESDDGQRGVRTDVVARQVAAVQQAVPLIDRLLPYGTVVISAAVVSRLLRQLLKSGKAFKALRLSAGIVHLARMLRHAVRLPAPHLVPASKLVHRRVWSDKKQRKVHVQRRVATLRLVDPLAKALAASRRHGQPAAGLAEGGGADSVRPIAMAYEVREEVMGAVVQVGLSHGEAGRALVEGVVQDSLTRALVDYTAGRTLPCDATPSRLRDYLTRSDLCGGGGGDAAAWDGRTTPQSGLPAPRTLCVKEDTQGIVPCITALVQSRITAREPPTALYAEGATSSVQAYYVAPTASCLELLLASLAQGDRARQMRYEAILQSDLARFATPNVMLVWQDSRVKDRHRRTRALRALQRVWTELLCSNVLSAVMPRATSRTMASQATTTSAQQPSDGLSAVWSALSQEARVRAARTDKDDVDEVTMPEMADFAMRRQAISSVAQVKAYLQGLPSPEEGEANAKDAAAAAAARKAKSHVLPQLSDAEYLLRCWSREVQPDVRHQKRLLWAITVTALINLDEDMLTEGSTTSSVGSSRAHSLKDFAARLLQLAFLVAMSLQDANYIDATVKALLLCPLMQDGTAQAGATSGTRATRADVARDDMPHTCSTTSFIQLQLCAAHELTSGNDKEQVSTNTVAMLETLCAKYNAYDLNAVKRSPVWRLYSSMLQQPVVADLWLHHTLTHITQPLFLWMVAHSHRNEADTADLFVHWATDVAAAINENSVAQMIRYSFARR